MHLNLFLKKKEWFDKSYRDSVYSNEIYFTQYVEFYDKNLSKSEIKSIAIEKAKIDFCKMLITEISTNSNTSISEVSRISKLGQDDVFNSVYNQNSSTSSSASISGLTEDYFFTKRKKCHVFIFVKKEDYKKATLRQFNDLVITIESKILTCQKIYSNNNLRSAKIQGDEISESLKNLTNKISLLNALNVNINLDRYIKLKQDFDPLYAKIDEEILEMKIIAIIKLKEISFSSTTIDGLENSLYFYKKAQDIDPASSHEDNIQSLIIQIEETLFNKYCKSIQPRN